MIKLCRKYYKFLRIIKRSQFLYILLSFSYKGRRCHSKARCGFSDATISLKINMRISVPFYPSFFSQIHRYAFRPDQVLTADDHRSLHQVFQFLMFPGRRYSFKSSSVSKEKDFLKPYFLFSFPRNSSARDSISFLRPLRGGIWIGNTIRR